MENGCEGHRPRNWSLRLLLIGLLMSASCKGESVKYEKALEGCKKLQLGDTEQIVRELMGEPMKIDQQIVNSGKGRVLLYSAPALIATIPQIYLDENGHIDEIICYESYRLKKRN